MPDETVHDSPLDWVAKHIKTYVANDGRQRKGAKPMLLLTTLGRRSGKWRRTALYYWRDGESYVVVASDGGTPHHPAWYLNLAAQPEAVVQVGGETFPAVARTATAEEKPRLWAMVVATMPMYDGFQRKTARDIPVVLLSPGSGATGR
jgi:deazaflavin-dependent oxidoreductase (nitroreductase family)